MRKIKVIFCTDGIFPYSVGGMQRHSRLLIEALSKHTNLDIIVIHPHISQSVFRNANVLEIAVDPIDVNKNYLIECYRYSKRIFQVLKSMDSDIVYSQGLSVWYNIGKVKGPVIVNPHGLESYQAIGFQSSLVGILFKKIFNYIFAHAKVVVSLGGKLTDILRRNVKDHKKIVEIPNGVQARLKPSTEQIKYGIQIQALFVGRFADNKGISVLFDALKILKDHDLLDNFVFNLAGKGPLLKYFQDYNTFSNVRILGGLSDEELDHLYSTSDVLILPTLYEGMPTVILEAMSYGLPIIASDVGAVAEMVDKTNGILVSPGSASELAGALQAFLKLSVNELNEMRASSFQKVMARFTWPQVAQTHYQLFEKLAGERFS